MANGVQVVVSGAAARYARKRGNLIYVWGTSFGLGIERLHVSTTVPGGSLEFHPAQDAPPDCPVALAINLPDRHEEGEPFVVNVRLGLFRRGLTARWKSPVWSFGGGRWGWVTRYRA